MDVLASKFILYPSDYEGSLRFYRDVLGLAVFREYPGGTVFFAGGGLIELAGHGESAPPEPGKASAVYLQVRDVYAAERELRAAGAEIEREAKQEPWGLHELRVRDPQGTLLILAHVPEDHPQRRAGKPPAQP
ncbi:Glyoxalase/bleomycin resistance protein/dioxygenase [Segniliparus rotundus DSM 44985]|uniref:Glyoxalase/bleomycin resistance protein/dioxygenase n=1 Tax=Segniliparus rotundus (strain ATCC BAA-972 / CDC 1076 / CIP 108378 / DSM 44985 / JCM 13578) TaxID=640132 RepID=D6ZCP4_SEGRD|nr:VOC family protein [Segniliparus rotundus]ADG97086.1 Glyoxalase/bleomycin resistance protein/dioxygenase [Segniliparus rotundus DSM 44985]